MISNSVQFSAIWYQDKFKMMLDEIIDKFFFFYLVILMHLAYMHICNGYALKLILQETYKKK